MSKKNRMPKPTIDECRQVVLDFHKKQTEFKEMQSHFGDEKAKFNSMMEDLFKGEDIEKTAVFTNCGVDGSCERYTVTRVQKVSVDFDPDRLEKSLGKEISKKVVRKSYEIIDIDGLIAYLKECDVDPKIFKSFLQIFKSVDLDELNKLEELGEISMEQVEGCYTVKRQNPYFTVSVKRGQNDGETKW